MLRSLFAAVWFVGAVANVATTRDGHAQPTSAAIAKPKNAQALDHLAKGNKLYNVRSFAEAADEYKAGALVESAPIFDYNLGQCYRQLGKYEDAIWHYQRFIKSSPNVTQHVDAASKFVTQMQDELNKKAMTAPPTEAAPTSSPIAAPIPAPQPQPEEPPVLETPPWYADKLGLTLTISGAVGVGVATGLLISSDSIRDEANASTSQRERDELFDKAETRSTIGIITMVGGGALLATGIVLLAIPEKRVERASVSVGLQPNGITFYGRF